MGKLFAVVLTVIALLSAVPIITHHWFGSDISFALPEDISTHGHAIDEQLSETMIEAGLSFLAAQILLAFFVWKFADRKPDAHRPIGSGDVRRAPHIIGRAHQRAPSGPKGAEAGAADPQLICPALIV